MQENPPLSPAKKSHKKKKKSNTTSSYTPEMILELLEKGNKPLRMDQILQYLNLKKQEKKNISKILQQLSQEERIMRIHGGKWVVADKVQLFTGIFRIQRNNIAYVDTPNLSFFIHFTQRGDAWHGDTVSVMRLPRKHSSTKPEGRIVEIIERKNKELMVRIPIKGDLDKQRQYKRIDKDVFSESPIIICKPCDIRFNFDVEIEKESIPSSIYANLKPNSLLWVRPFKRRNNMLWVAEVISEHGQEDNVKVQEELVKLNHQVPRDFPSVAIKESDALPTVPDVNDYEGRKDVRNIPFVTIDGETARDFDDAIYVQKQKNGGWILQVGIADVSHYVKAKSALDKEARLRGNSWYFPTSVEPMFPKTLSNGLCSLNPHVDRLIMLATLHFDKAGNLHKSHFNEAVLCSHARLSYTEVKNLVLDKDEEIRQEFLKAEHGDIVLPMLEEAEQLARILANKRSERGTLDFHMPEANYHFDDEGHIVNISRKEQHFAYQIIEEFMIAANEAVAEFLQEQNVPTLYRVHPEPENSRIESLFRTLASTALAKDIPSKPDAKDIQHILHKAKGTKQEFLVARLALRTMSQARYQADNDGHFGLASTCYCHFTSPIRRYADIIVHRALKFALNLSTEPIFANHKLLALGDSLNQTERASMEAEREMARRLAVLMLQGHEGRIYEGIISGIAEFGIFVELDIMPVEGLVHIGSLGRDFFDYNADKQELIGNLTGIRYALGQRVSVQVKDVNLGRLEITLELLSAEKLERAKPSRQRAKRKSNCI